MQTLYLVHLDRHHLGDELFLNSLAQHLARGPSGEPPCLLVHGSGEKVERTLEAKGLFPERTNGVLDVDGEEQRRLVERAVREVNQEIVAALTDEVVSTVGVQGVDRNLLGLDEDGRVQASNVGWLAALVKQRIVPVVSSLVENGSVQEVRPADVVVALAEGLSSSFDPVACVFTTTDQAGVETDAGVESEVGVDALNENEVPASEAVRRISEAGVPILLTSVKGLFGPDDVQGTQVVPTSGPSGGTTSNQT